MKKLSKREFNQLTNENSITKTLLGLEFLDLFEAFQSPSFLSEDSKSCYWYIKFLGTTYTIKMLKVGYGKYSRWNTTVSSDVDPSEFAAAIEYRLNAASLKERDRGNMAFLKYVQIK